MNMQLSRSCCKCYRRPAPTVVCSASSPAPSTSHSITYRIRRATTADAAHVSDVYAKVFGAGNFPGYDDNPFIKQVEAQYASAVNRESSEKLVEALTNKAQAAVAARTYRLMRQAALLKGQLAMAQGLPASFPTEGPSELRQLAKWRRARRFVCFVVEAVEAAALAVQGTTLAAGATTSSGSSSSSSTNSSSTSSPSNGSPISSCIIGTATISMMQAEAALPPPFPSNAPLRPYLSNMAVLPEHRRRGVAKALAGACGRVAQAWGEPTVLLHVAAENTTAQQLYLSCGFAPIANSQGLSGLLKGPWTQQRMAADAGVLAAAYSSGSTGGRRTSSSSRGLVAASS